MIFEFSGLLLGLVGLWLGTEWAVNNAILIAQHYHLSELFVGVGILAIGSDLPELAVAVDAGIKVLNGIPASEMVIGSSIGSAFAQIGLVMGVAGYSGYLVIGKKFLIQHGSVLIGSIVVLWILGYDGVLDKPDGAILSILFCLYLILLLKQELQTEVKESRNTGPVVLVWGKLVSGIAVVVAASEITVHSALGLAERLEIAQALLATLIIGLGTSLPELSISLKAIHQKRGALSVGYIIGSNIFDTLVPIGCAALIAPLLMAPHFLYFDLPFLAAISLLVIFFFSHKKGLQKRESVYLLSIYCLYGLTSILYKEVI